MRRVVGVADERLQEATTAAGPLRPALLHGGSVRRRRAGRAVGWARLGVVAQGGLIIAINNNNNSY